MKPDSRIVRLAARQQGLITRKQCLSAGMSRHEVDGLMGARWFEVVHPGVYRVAGCPRTWEQAVMAACLSVGPEAVASGRSAAFLWGMPVGPAPVELTVPLGLRPAVRGPILHRTNLRTGDRARVKGIPVTTPMRTLVDLASVVDRPVLEDVLDDSAERPLVRLPKLHDYLDSLGRSGRRGAGVLNDLLVARLDVQRVQQSRFERNVLAFVRKYRLPEPQLQYPVKLPDGDTKFLDVAWPWVVLGLEAESYRYHSSLTSWSRDRTRNNAIVALGWRLLAVTSHDLRSRAADFAAELRRALDVLPALGG